MYSLIRPLLFKLDAEKAHQLTLKLLDYLPGLFFRQAASVAPVHCMGLQFPHPVGLAAGLDKNGEHLDGLARMGFSFIELGTVTPRPQEGNPKPRLFRLPEAQAIINRMGFNNRGVDALVTNVRKSRYQGILGINIGKNKDTSLNQAAEDYLYCLRKVYACASYVTINISSPNTPDLRMLQQEDYLQDLLDKLVSAQQELADSHQRKVPLVLKLSPDESDESLKNIADLVNRMGISGIIATNTTCARTGVESLAQAAEQGGLSGKPLYKRSTDCLRIIKQVVGNEVAIIGVGGIDSVQNAREKMDAGASLLQVYTGLIYQGPQWIGSLVQGL